MNHVLSTVSRNPTSLLGSLVLVILLTACTQTPTPPTTSLSAAQGAIVNATEAGAEQYASFELGEAQRQLVLAEQAVDAEDMLAAELLAKQSLIAAELAMARAESAQAMAINQEMSWGASELDTHTLDADKAREELTAALGYSALTAADLQRRMNELEARATPLAWD